MMERGVSADAQQLKVFQSIVGLVSIPVVDVLGWLKCPSKVLRHDDTVLKLESRADTHCDVSV